MHQALFDDVKFTLIEEPQDNTPTSFTEAAYRVDMKDYDYVDFIIAVGSLADAPTFKVVENTAATGGSSSDVSGATSAEVNDSTGDESLIIISVRKETLTKRYVTIAYGYDADGSSPSLVSIVAARYGGSRMKPVSQLSADTDGEGFKTLETVKV